jgi:hypothetical protein
MSSNLMRRYLDILNEQQINENYMDWIKGLEQYGVKLKGPNGSPFKSTIDDRAFRDDLNNSIINKIPGMSTGQLRELQDIANQMIRIKRGDWGNELGFMLYDALQKEYNRRKQYQS